MSGLTGLWRAEREEGTRAPISDAAVRRRLVPEWACMEAMQPHLDDGEQSVGTGVWVTHGAATAPGMTVTVDVTLTKVEGRKVTFSVRAHDGVDSISEGTHERFVVDRARFVRKVAEKAAAAGV